MNNATRFRMICIAALWLILCYLLIVGQREFTLKPLFIIIASGIVVFVPLYKKYKKENKRK